MRPSSQASPRHNNCRPHPSKVRICNSKLVISQVLGSWRTKEPRLMPYQALAERLVKEFEHVPREENGLADALATLASVVMCLSDQTRTGSQAHPGDKADKQPTFLPPVQMSRGRYLIQGGKFITDAPGTTSQLSAEFKHSRLGEEERYELLILLQDAPIKTDK